MLMVIELTPIPVTVAPEPTTIVWPNLTWSSSWLRLILDVLIPVIRVVVTPIVPDIIESELKNNDSVAWIISPGINALVVVPIPTFDILSILL